MGSHRQYCPDIDELTQDSGVNNNNQINEELQLQEKVLQPRKCIIISLQIIIYFFKVGFKNNIKSHRLKKKRTGLDQETIIRFAHPNEKGSFFNMILHIPCYFCQTLNISMVEIPCLPTFRPCSSKRGFEKEVSQYKDIRIVFFF